MHCCPCTFSSSCAMLFSFWSSSLFQFLKPIDGKGLKAPNPDIAFRVRLSVSLKLQSSLIVYDFSPWRISRSCRACQIPYRPRSLRNLNFWSRIKLLMQTEFVGISRNDLWKYRRQIFFWDLKDGFCSFSVAFCLAHGPPKSGSNDWRREHRGTRRSKLIKCCDLIIREIGIEKINEADATLENKLENSIILHRNVNKNMFSVWIWFLSAFAIDRTVIVIDL